MSDLELREKLVDKLGEMVEKCESVDALHKLADAYSILTKETWATALMKTFEEAKQPVNDGTIQRAFDGIPPIAEGLK